MLAPVPNRGEHASMSRKKTPVSESLEAPGASSGTGHYGYMPPAPGFDGAYGYQQPPVSMVPARPPVTRIEVGDALKWAWAKTFANPLIIAWIPLSLLAVALVVSGLVSVVGEDNGALIAAIGIPMALLWGLMVVLGLYTAALRIARGEKVTFRSLVVPPHGFDAAAALVLVGLAGFIASLFPLGGLVVGYFCWVAVVVVMNEGCSCFKAIGRSYRLMRQGGNAPLLALTIIPVYFGGLLTVIGLLVAIPMIFLMTVYVYMRMSGGDVAR